MYSFYGAIRRGVFFYSMQNDFFYRRRTRRRKARFGYFVEIAFVVAADSKCQLVKLTARESSLYVINLTNNKFTVCRTYTGHNYKK